MHFHEKLAPTHTNLCYCYLRIYNNVTLIWQKKVVMYIINGSGWTEQKRNNNNFRRVPFVAAVLCVSLFCIPYFKNLIEHSPPQQLCGCRTKTNTSNLSQVFTFSSDSEITVCLCGCEKKARTYTNANWKNLHMFNLRLCGRETNK